MPGSGIPGMNRILRVGMCRRGENPRRVVSRPSGREGAHGFGHFRGRAKRTSGATARESVRGSLAGRTPWRSKPRRGGGEPTSRYSRGELEQRGANAQECGGRAATRGLLSPRARRALEGRRRFGRPDTAFFTTLALTVRRGRDEPPPTRPRHFFCPHLPGAARCSHSRWKGASGDRRHPTPPDVRTLVEGPPPDRNSQDRPPPQHRQMFALPTRRIPG